MPIRSQLTESGPERVAASAPVFSSMGYALNNPLQIILGNAEQLLADRACTRAEDAGRLEAIRESTLRAAGIVRGLLVLARHRQPFRRTVYVAAVLESVLAARASSLAAGRVTVAREWDRDAQLPADGPLLEEVFTRLVTNAEEAMRPAGSGTLILRVERPAPLAVRVTIEDTGPGFPDDLGDAFDPFTTTKRAGTGGGLGLAICQSIVLEHGGSIWAGDAWHGGARVVVDLPVESDPPRTSIA